MNIKNWLNIVIVVVLMVVAFFMWKLYTNKSQKIVYIELEKVYEEFELSKYYNAKVEEYHNASQTVLDSLELEINMLIKYNSNSNLIAQAKEKYFTKRNEFEQVYQQQTQQYSEKVMKQLNQYLEDFGSTNHYDYIMIKQLKSQLIYANKNNDVTNEVISYVNNKYQGK